MRAVRFHEYGGDVSLDEIDPPEVGKGMVRVKVHAASFNPIDLNILDGDMKFLWPKKRPCTLGADLAGEVESVGDGVQGFAVGDRVLALLEGDTGAQADLAAVPADRVGHLPDRVSYVEAAACTATGMTALQALRDIAHEKPGAEVLVNGASGGVGVMAVQIAKHLGGRVTAVCSGRSHGLVRELGAAEVIDYHDTDFTQSDQRWDVVFDVSAQSSFARCARVLAEHGAYVTTLPGVRHLMRQALNFMLDKQALTIIVKGRTDELEELAGWVADGAVRPVVHNVFDVAQIAEVHALGRKGGFAGKLVLSFAD